MSLGSPAIPQCSGAGRESPCPRQTLCSQNPLGQLHIHPQPSMLWSSRRPGSVVCSASGPGVGVPCYPEFLVAARPSFPPIPESPGIATGSQA